MRSIHTLICWIGRKKDVKWKRDGEELAAFPKINKKEKKKHRVEAKERNKN